MMDNSGFMAGVWCGVMFGAAMVMLVVSLIFESSQRKQARQLRSVQKIWNEGLPGATMLEGQSEH